MSNILAETEQGTVKGTTGINYYGGLFYKFLGIPYAKPPIGELRFKAPEAPEPWDGVRDATRNGPECPSPDLYFTYFIGKEDNCLNLNIYTKQLPSENDLPKKPVMVWIHGGGFVYGCNKEEMFGPQYFMTQDIVLVAINYRLGILGFACFEDKSLGIFGNAGLKDMRMALTWVQNNISNFGGDPNNVTIFGESAGGAAVHYLTLSPTTKGLFHKAIMQSGCALNPWAIGKVNSLDIANCLGFKDKDEKQILEKLKLQSARQIVKAQQTVPDEFYPGKRRFWVPVVEEPNEGAFLTEHPYKILSSGQSHNIPMIIGYTTREGILFDLIRKAFTCVKLPRDFELEVPHELGLEKGTETSKEVASKFKNYYFGDEECNESNIDKVYVMKGDSLFLHGIHRSFKLHNLHSQEPIYIYRVSLEASLNYFKFFSVSNYFKTMIVCNFITKISSNSISPIHNATRKLLTKIPRRQTEGVSHADDLFYMFTTFFTPPISKGSKEDVYIQRFIKMWTNFATHGNPTPEDDQILCNVKWDSIRPDKIEFLDIGSQLNLISNEDEDRLKIWDELYDTHYEL